MLKEKKKKKEKEELLNNYKFLSFNLKANSAKNSPFLNSVLGNLGLNLKKFCDDFNKLTEDLSSYFLVKVYLKVDLISRSWKLKVGTVPVTYIFRLISLKEKKKYYGSGGFFFKDVSYIFLFDFFLVLLFLNLKLTEKEIRKKMSILKSMNIVLKIN